MRIPFRCRARDRGAFDVAGLGLNSIDLVAVVAEYPGRNTKQRLQRFARLPGGQIATALAVCARLGWTTRYVGSFGDDELGRVSRESLTAEGVDIGGVAHGAGRHQSVRRSSSSMRAPGSARCSGTAIPA